MPSEFPGIKKKMAVEIQVSRVCYQSRGINLWSQLFRGVLPGNGEKHIPGSSGSVCKICAWILPTKTYQFWQDFYVYLEDPGMNKHGLGRAYFQTFLPKSQCLEVSFVIQSYSSSTKAEQ